MRQVRLRLEAEHDIEDAALWYQSQRQGLGHQFLGEVSAVLGAISEGAESFPVVHREVRRALTKKFPFGIYYRIEADCVVVLAVIHASRHPRQWKDRS